MFKESGISDVFGVVVFKESGIFDIFRVVAFKESGISVSSAETFNIDTKNIDQNTDILNRPIKLFKLL